MKSLTILLVLVMLGLPGLSNNLQISNVSFEAGTNYISFDVSWDNSWRDATGNFHDAVWVFVKYRPALGQWQHADMLALTNYPTGMEVLEPGDNKGIFIRRDDQNTGNGNNASATYTFEVIGSFGDSPSFKVFGIEMVNVPEGPFYAGGLSNSILGQYLMNSSNDNGLYIDSEALIPATDYDLRDDGSVISTGVDIPAAFPKGYSAFYCMKYDISQEQYVEFLNSLTTSQQESRVEVDLSTPGFAKYVMSDNTAPTSRSGIAYNGVSSQFGNHQFGCDLNNNDVMNEVDDGQNIICNYLNYSDVLAYLDWSALRPWTRLEIWKLCRGPLFVVDNEYAWGSSIFTPINSNPSMGAGTASETFVGGSINGPLTGIAIRSGIFATGSSTRITAGATYYGILDIHTLSSWSVGSFTDASSLLFAGQHGDGVLSPAGSSQIPPPTRISSLGLFDINAVQSGNFVDSDTRNMLLSGRGVRTIF